MANWLVPSASDRWYRLSARQVAWLVGQVVFLVGAFLCQWAANAETTSLLWNDPLGVKMAVTGGTMLAVNFVALVGGCWLFNAFLAARWEGRPVLPNLVLGAHYAVCFVLFYLPAVFVVWVGPSAVSIQRSLLAS